jgi:hypothetical protein
MDCLRSWRDEPCQLSSTQPAAPTYLLPSGALTRPAVGVTRGNVAVGSSDRAGARGQRGNISLCIFGNLRITVHGLDISGPPPFLVR